MSTSYVRSPARSRWGLTLLILSVLVIEAGLGARALAEIVRQALWAETSVSHSLTH